MGLGGERGMGRDGAAEGRDPMGARGGRGGGGGGHSKERGAAVMVYQRCTRKGALEPEASEHGVAARDRGCARRRPHACSHVACNVATLHGALSGSCPGSDAQPGEAVVSSNMRRLGGSTSRHRRGLGAQRYWPRDLADRGSHEEALQRHHQLLTLHHPRQLQQCPRRGIGASVVAGEVPVGRRAAGDSTGG